MNGARLLLERHSIVANRALGQNFLVDRAALDAIAEAACGDGAPALEVGAGLGDLTAALAARSRRVVAVEIDGRFDPVLNERFAGSSNVSLVRADFLKLDMERAFELLGREPFCVAANLPYYITTPISLKLAGCALPIERMCLMVQEEAAERFSAQPGSRVYGPLAILVQARFAVSTLFTLPPSAFYPAPDVNSAVIRLAAARRDVPKQLRRVAALAFASRRKTLVNNLLSAGFEKDAVHGALDELGLPRPVRAEAVDVESFVRLTRILAD
ncbi:MAG: 16S rRNA (adenine(1518)-N(6)/adenine(1519)-N(6))-dimethyltransferase RsmA [Clostridia bacterium]|nr:16S rRNA (adenine(1518)-N(6)/adenine(1519)-N(6))-dimethyltransferase RsmA [Clostridia bacterium]